VAVGVAAVVLSASGCGSGQPAPVDQQPKLAGLLTDVDDEITAGHLVLARKSLNALVAATESARGAGALDMTSAERVLAAAAGLETKLTTSIQGGRTPVTSTEPTTSGDEGDGDNSGPGEGGNGHEGHGKPEHPTPDKPPKPHDHKQD
jgi:hypothetical protein